MKNKRLETHEVVRLKALIPLAKHVMQFPYDWVLGPVGWPQAEERGWEQSSLSCFKQDTFVPAFCCLQNLDHISNRKWQLVSNSFRLDPVSDSLVIEQNRARR